MTSSMKRLTEDRFWKSSKYVATRSNPSSLSFSYCSRTADGSQATAICPARPLQDVWCGAGVRQSVPRVHLLVGQEAGQARRSVCSRVRCSSLDVLSRVGPWTWSSILSRLHRSYVITTLPPMDTDQVGMLTGPTSFLVRISYGGRRGQQNQFIFALWLSRQKPSAALNWPRHRARQLETLATAFPLCPRESPPLGQPFYPACVLGLPRDPIRTCQLW